MIFVNGTFDILHTGHIFLLNYAKSLGDYLLVAIDSDDRVKKLKGNSRPINNQYDRQIMLQNLKSVNEVVIFSTDKELVNLIQKCDVMVKGSDYIDKPIIGADVCSKIIFFDRINGYSTTEKIQSIIDRR